jgi:2-amino-4-hydroxy-6-hydroxymethyldihydropteridine diphosphokinase
MNFPMKGRVRAQGGEPVLVDAAADEAVAVRGLVPLAQGRARQKADDIMDALAVRAPVTALVAIGANLGDARAAAVQAIEALDLLPQSRCVRVSALYRTAPHQANGPDFINAVVALETALTAPDLLRALQELEYAAGRERPYPNAPRTLDLDLLMYGDASLQSPALTLPHPRWQERAFVLYPMRDVAPERVSEAMLAAVAGQAIQRWE